MDNLKNRYQKSVKSELQTRFGYKNPMIVPSLRKVIISMGLAEASKDKHYKGYLEVSNEQLVLTDIVGNPASCIVDLGLTQVVDGNFVKVIAWYDNEFGYSNRLVEEVIMVGAN